MDLRVPSTGYRRVEQCHHLIESASSEIDSTGQRRGRIRPCAPRRACRQWIGRTRVCEPVGVRPSVPRIDRRQPLPISERAPGAGAGFASRGTARRVSEAARRAGYSTSVALHQRVQTPPPGDFTRVRGYAKGQCVAAVLAMHGRPIVLHRTRSNADLRLEVGEIDPQALQKRVGSG